MNTFTLRPLGGQMDTYYLCKELSFAFVGEETNIHYYMFRANER